MATTPTPKQLIKKLEAQVKKLQKELALVNTPIPEDQYIDVKIQKSQGRFVRVKKEKENDHGIGHYFLLIQVHAKSTDVYMPVSIASGKKSTGFVYMIEGTAEGNIVKTDISVRGEGLTQITSGTLKYAKIPKGKKAEFRIQIEMRGKIGKSYTIVIDRIHYKLAPSDARYKRADKTLRSRTVEFK